MKRLFLLLLPLMGTLSAAAWSGDVSIETPNTMLILHATYTLTEKNVRVGKKPCSLSGKRFTGRFLMEVGLEVPLREEYASRVFFIED